MNKNMNKNRIPNEQKSNIKRQKNQIPNEKVSNIK